jgi:hypothetical protein
LRGPIYVRTRRNQLDNCRDPLKFADCCDGSDENSGKCPNTCAEAGAANRAAMKARSTALKLGLKAKEKYISKAVTGRKEWQQELVRVSEEAAGLQKTVTKLQGASFFLGRKRGRGGGGIWIEQEILRAGL